MQSGPTFAKLNFQRQSATIKAKSRKYWSSCLNSVSNHDFLLALVIVTAIVLTALICGWSNNHLIPIYPKAHYHYTQEPHNPLSFMSDWDGPDYLSIAAHGYHNLFQANFFPLYPLAIYLVDLIIRSRLLSALLISWFSLVGAVYFFIKTLKHLGVVSTQKESLQSAFFLLLFPTGIFLIATYTESLFALLSLASIYFSMQRRFFLASILLLLCSACHITGIFTVICCALILYEKREKLRNILFTAFTGCLGLVAYMVYLHVRLGNALAFLKAQKQIHGWFKNGYLGLITNADLLNIVLVILLVTAAVYYFRRGLKSFAIYCLLFLAIPLIGRQYGGFNRYVLMAFPVQFMLYNFFRSRQQLYPYILLLMGIVWTYFTLQYSGGYIGS
jgi:hypothetical protein